MDRKEAILRIKEHMKHHGIGKYPHLKLKEALDMAIAALSQPNEPLTCDGCTMQGEPDCYTPCSQCIRDPRVCDYYDRRPPEGEEDT